MLLLVAKTTPIRLKATGTLGTINEGVDQEVKGVKIEVAEAKDVAMGAKTNHKGHYQANYFIYKRLQAQYMKEQEDKGDGKAQAQGKAQANVAIATRMSYDQIKDAGFPCFTVPYISHAMPSVTSHKYALRTINKVQLYLDSGATRHFSSIKSDFTQLKH